MDKVIIASILSDRERLLDRLGEMGVLHLTPVDPQKAVALAGDVERIRQYDKAIRILETVRAGQVSEPVDSESLVTETLQLHHDAMMLSEKLKVVQRQIEQTALWGDTDPHVLEQLHTAGVQVEFLIIPARDMSFLRAECIEPLNIVSHKKLLVAVINRDSECPLPGTALLLEKPSQCRRDLMGNAQEIQNRIRHHQERLSELASLSGQLEYGRACLQEKADFFIATASGMDQEPIVAFQGWTPVSRTRQLGKQLSDSGLDVALCTRRAFPSEEPPTLISYPRWARPIKGILDMLGTTPGYSEADISPFIMLALPIFSALLIGDAGYGVLFILVAIILRRWGGDKMGRETIHLLAITGAATVIWGMATANYFGFCPAALPEGGGAGQVRKYLLSIAVFWNSDSDIMRQWFMQFSLILGCVHLTLARLQQALRLLPGAKMWAQFGWCIVLWVMLVVIWILFFGASFSATLLMVIGGAGLMMVILFSHAGEPFFKRIGLGLAGAILPLMGTFSDTMSYIRLMAVGLASFYIAAAFNSLAVALADSATWLVAVWVLLFGHALNIALCIIAIFAHGVRLNLLEFSSNAAVQWSGYRYTPFSAKMNL